MDHLKTPRHPVYPKPIVKFLGRRYDGNDFFTYQRDCGIQISDIYRSPEATVCIREVASFLQAYLFLGLARQFFNVSDDDFIDVHRDGQREEKIITTSKIDAFRLEWVIHASKTRKSNPSELYRLLERYSQCLEAALDLLALIGDPVREEMTEEVYISVKLLMQYLMNMMHIIHQPKPGMPNRRIECSEDYLILNRFRDQGWCANTIRLFSYHNNIEGMYYISTMDVKVPGDHKCCTPSKCVANQVGAKYTSKHALQRCIDPSSCIFQGGSQEEMLSILKTGFIPLITYDSSKIQLIKSEERRPYVAISHVWSQGTGNPVSNSLPKCQLVRISEMVNALYPVSARPVPFWIDTICCPLQPPEAYKIAMGRMTNTYENADKVLVLDSSLQDIPLPGNDSRKDSFEECLIRVFASPWMRRLWTLQEAQLAHRLYIQFSDGPLDIDDAIGKTIDCGNNLVDYMLERIASLDELSDEEQLKVIEESLRIRARGIYGYFESLQNRLRLRQHDYKIWLVYLESLMNCRSVSVAEDEALCIGTLLQLDIGRLLGVEAGYRMALVWIMLDERNELSQSLFFHTGPKLSYKGFRWAPKSLLRYEYEQLIIQTSPKAKRADEGLYFHTSGFVMDHDNISSLENFSFRSRSGYRYCCYKMKAVGVSDSNFTDGNDMKNDVLNDPSATCGKKAVIAVIIDTGKKRLDSGSRTAADDSMSEDEIFGFTPGSNYADSALVVVQKLENGCHFVRFHGAIEVWRMLPGMIVSREELIQMCSPALLPPNDMNNNNEKSTCSERPGQTQAQALRYEDHADHADMSAVYLPRAYWCCE